MSVTCQEELDRSNLIQFKQVADGKSLGNKLGCQSLCTTAGTTVHSQWQTNTICLLNSFPIIRNTSLQMQWRDVKPGTHWRQIWNRQQSWLLPYKFNFGAGFGNKSATMWIPHLVGVDCVADPFNYAADTVSFVADTADFVEFNLVASVYHA